MDPTVEDLHSNPKKKGQCLKITEKVTFNMACGQTVLPDRSILIGQKLVKNAKIEKTQMRHFE